MQRISSLSQARRNLRISSVSDLYLKKVKWSSGLAFALALLNIGVGINNSEKLTQLATKYSPTAVIFTNILVFMLMVRSIIYVEMFVSQFTNRDCIDVWKIRPCFTHIGYITVFWQILILFYNHVMSSFILHYLLIIFERPVPFYTCEKRTQDCGIFRNNLTVNDACTRHSHLEPLCKELYKTYSEYQYWAMELLDIDNPNSFVRWNLCLSSAIISIIIYLSVFKRTSSLKYFLFPFAFFPIVAYLIIAMGSMLQKGLVNKFEEVIDVDFDRFSLNFRLSCTVTQVMNSLKVGTGLYQTMASTTNIRSPCKSNVSILCAVACCFNVLAIITSCMFFCAYTYVNEFQVISIIEEPTNFIFVKVPRLLFDYSDRYVWLILFFSSNLVLGLSCSALIFFCLQELASRRCRMVTQYPGLFTFLGIIALFLLTLPLVSNFGINTFNEAIHDFANLMTPFMVLLEYMVFVVTYGSNRFTEDVHFLQGDRPNIIKRVLFGTSIVFMAWATISEFSYYASKSDLGVESDLICWIMIGLTLGAIILGIAIKFSMGLYRRRIKEVWRMDPKWGPDSETLRRSREMFSARAITKEYVYRQNQLQAGITARQRRSNVRDNACSRQTRQLISVQHV